MKILRAGLLTLAVAAARGVPAVAQPADVPSQVSAITAALQHIDSLMPDGYSIAPPEIGAQGFASSALRQPVFMALIQATRRDSLKLYRPPSGCREPCSSTPTMLTHKVVTVKNLQIAGDSATVEVAWATGVTVAPPARTHGHYRVLLRTNGGRWAVVSVNQVVNKR